MTTTSTNFRPPPAIEVKLGKSRYETHRPELIVPVHPTLSFREVNATLYDVAAAVERATPVGERWCVSIDNGVIIDPYGRGSVVTAVRVSLELLNDTEAEAMRGLDLLRKVAELPRMLRIPTVNGKGRVKG